MVAQIATCALGENDPGLAEAIRARLSVLVNPYAHSEYQKVTALQFKSARDRLAPAGLPRHLVVNTGPEAVETALQAALLLRSRMAGIKEGGVIVSFEGAFHGRTLGALRSLTAKWRASAWLTLRFDVPLIFDEAQTGCGATGKMWAQEHFNPPAPPLATLSSIFSLRLALRALHLVQHLVPSCAPRYPPCP
jgi:4-aminobutyrate aminotransferase-like enzyme